MNRSPARRRLCKWNFAGLCFPRGLRQLTIPTNKTPSITRSVSGVDKYEIRGYVHTPEPEELPCRYTRAMEANTLERGFIAAAQNMEIAKNDKISHKHTSFD